MSIRGNEVFESALPHSESIVRAIVQRHMIAEHGNDPEVVIPTVSSFDQFYAILAAAESGPQSRRPAGNAPNAGWETAFYGDPSGVREHYIGVKAVVHAAEPNTEKRYFDFVGRWYQFSDTTINLRLVNTGEIVSWRGAFLFATWVDGIIGEITWMVDPAQVELYEDLSGDGVPPLFVASEELTARLDECDRAWRLGEFEKKLAHFEDETRSAFGIAEVNGPGRNKVVANAKQELLKAWSRPEAGKVLEFERLHHIVSTFYVFAHYRMRVDLGNRTVVRETVMTIPVSPDRKFIGELSYSLEVAV